MALRNCRECGETVASSAKSCPHCGVSTPGGGCVYTGTGCGGCANVLVILVCLGFLGMCFMAL